MSIDQFVTALKVRRWLALGIQGAVVLAVLVVSLLIPSRYTASASVLVDVKSTDPVAGTTVDSQMLSAHIANEVNVIQSERVMLRALKNLGLLDDPKYKAKWVADTNGEGDFSSWLAARLGRDLEIKPSREGSVLNVQVNSTERTFAAELANAVVTAYVEISLELRTEPAQRFTEFFNERAKSARDAVETAQRRLSAYQQSKGIVATDERLDIESSRLAELSTQLTALQATASESANRKLQAERNAELSPEVQSNPMIAQLNSFLMQQEARLAELQSRLSDQNPQIIELKAGIAQTQARLAAERARAVQSLRVPNDVNRSRIQEVSASLAAQRALVLRLKGERDEVGVLQRDLENAQRAYDAAFSRLNQSDLARQARQSNISLLKTATPPTRPSSPKILVNTVVALVLGGLFGLAAVYVRELTHRKLRSEEDVVDILGVPMLITLPDHQHSATVKPSLLRSLLGLPARPLRLEVK